MKYNICGGTKNIPGYVNVGIEPGADILHDIRQPLPIETNSATDIFCGATLEHFTLQEGLNILLEFRRILKNGGELVISVPCLKKLTEAYILGKITFELLNKYFYGAQKNEWDYHKAIYDADNLTRILKQAGFQTVVERPYQRPWHLKQYMLELVAK